MDRTERFYKIKELLRQRHFLKHGMPCAALGTASLRQVGTDEVVDNEAGKMGAKYI